jgi:hypothetical protein
MKTEIYKSPQDGRMYKNIKKSVCLLFDGKKHFYPAEFAQDVETKQLYLEQTFLPRSNDTDLFHYLENLLTDYLEQDSELNAMYNEQQNDYGDTFYSFKGAVVDAIDLIDEILTEENKIYLDLSTADIECAFV